MDTRVFMYRKGEAKLFASPAEIPAGEGWQDTPVPDDAPDAAPVPAPVAAPVEEPDHDTHEHLEKDALREKASALGISVDGRWSVKKLQRMIAEAESADE